MAINKKTSKENRLRVFNDRLLVALVEDPFEVTTTDSGIILPDGLAQSTQSGQAEMRKSLVMLVEVIATGRDVTDVVEGDLIYMSTGAGYPVFFGKEEYVTITIHDCLALVEEV